ncbi:unnamed protein product [Clonostachys rosea]|uniref:Autophagy-related protein 1 n=1 Tax=Bionectria ochroleuca TaxID=29856 RepID=A0ABY6TRS9_BIOOC|nr:unnamed protein product [Clonostachys rosea]
MRPATPVYFADLPEVVRDSRLEVSFLSNGAQHYTIHPRAVRNRRVQRVQDRWLRREVFAEGGQGSVELQVLESARASTGRPLMRAVKKIRLRLTSNSGDLKLVQRELKAIFKFSQPRYSELFVQPSGWFIGDEFVYIAMEYYELGDLQTYLDDPERCPSNRLKEQDVHDISLQVLDALCMMHAEQFSHRDVKPKNILIKQQPPMQWWVKLGDFGISKHGEEVTSHQYIRGTESFMPPELRFQWKTSEELAYAIDMWSLGEMVFRALTGRPTFKVEQLVGYCEKRLNFPISPLSDVGASENVIDFIQKLVLPDPAVRLTSDEASEHPWIGMHNTRDDDFGTHHGNEGEASSYVEPAIRPLPSNDEYSAEWADVLSQTTNLSLSAFNEASVKKNASLSSNILNDEASGTWNTNPVDKGRENPSVVQKLQSTSDSSGPKNDHLDPSIVAEDAHSRPQLPKLELKETLDESRINELRKEYLGLQHQLREAGQADKFDAEAEAMGRRVVEIAITIFSNEPSQVFKAKEQLGALLTQYGDKAKDTEAALIFQEVVDSRLSTWPEDYSPMLDSLGSLVYILATLGRISEAISATRTVFKAAPPPKTENLNLGTFDPALQGILFIIKSFDKSKEWDLPLILATVPEGVRISSQIYGVGTDSHLDYMKELAKEAFAPSLLEVDFERQTIPEGQDAMTETHAERVRALEAISYNFMKNKMLSEAEEILRQTHGLQSAVMGSHHALTITAMRHLAGVIAKQGRFLAAKRLFLDVIKLRTEILGPGHFLTAAAMETLAVHYMRSQKYSQAEELLRLALTERRELTGDDHVEIVDLMYKISRVCTKQGKLSDAVEMSRQVLQLAPKVLGEEHARILKYRKDHAALLQQV